MTKRMQEQFRKHGSNRCHEEGKAVSELGLHLRNKTPVTVKINNTLDEWYYVAILNKPPFIFFLKWSMIERESKQMETLLWRRGDVNATNA